MRKIAYSLVVLFVVAIIYFQGAALDAASRTIADRDLTIAALKILAGTAGDNVTALTVDLKTCRDDAIATVTLGRWLSEELQHTTAQRDAARAQAATCKST